MQNYPSWLLQSNLLCYCLIFISDVNIHWYLLIYDIDVCLVVISNDILYWYLLISDIDMHWYLIIISEFDILISDIDIWFTTVYIYIW